MRGHFGRRPKPSQNLTSLIVSLYREQRAAEDRVMFDAYQNGGKGLNGKPVTDGAMRGYIATRRNEFTHTDPLYSEWNNRLIQLDFKIGEEKITLSYQQGHVGAGAVASYYRQQLAHIPQDSEFYRTVAGRAAQWAKAAAGAARGAARARLTAAMQAKSDKVAKIWSQYSNLESILTDAAKRAGLIAGNQTLTDADATDLQAFLARGVAGPHGTTITMADWQRATLDAFRGFDSLIAINKQLGRGYKTLTNQKQSFLDQNLVRVNTIDDRAKYEIARDTFNQAVQNAKGDPRAILDAAQAYSKTLTSIKDIAAKGGSGPTGNDPEFIGGLNNEINALTTGKSNGGSSVYDLQSTSGEAAPSNDLASTAAGIAAAQKDVQALATGDAYFGQTDFGTDFKVTYYPPGAKLDPFGNNGLDKSFTPAVVSVDGTPTQVVLKGQPIQAFGLTDAKGNAVTTVPIGGKQVPIANLSADQIAALVQQGYKETQQPATIGYVYTDPGGQAVKYGVVQTDGSLVFTTQDPFTNLTPTKNGFVVFTGSATSGTNVIPDLASLHVDLTGVNGGDHVLADATVTPKDLLTLAANPLYASQAAALTAEAQKRQAGADAERNYMNQAQGKDYTKAPESWLGNAIGLGLQGVTNLIRGVSDTNVSGAPGREGQQSPLSLPILPPVKVPNLNQTPASPSMPAVSNPPAIKGLPPIQGPTSAAAAAAAAPKPITLPPLPKPTVVPAHTGTGGAQNLPL